MIQILANKIKCSYQVIAFAKGTKKNKGGILFTNHLHVSKCGLNLNLQRNPRGQYLRSQQLLDHIRGCRWWVVRFCRQKLTNSKLHIILLAFRFDLYLTFCQSDKFFFEILHFRRQNSTEKAMLVFRHSNDVTAWRNLFDRDSGESEARSWEQLLRKVFLKNFLLKNKNQVLCNTKGTKYEERVCSQFRFYSRLFGQIKKTIYLCRHRWPSRRLVESFDQSTTISCRRFETGLCTTRWWNFR